MELRTARLCLDCEEVHAEQQCPVCASESFAYLTRWIPITDRSPLRTTAPTTPTTPTAPAPTVTAAGTDPRGRSSLRWARRGALGVALVAISQWLWRNARPVEWAESGSGRQEETSSAPPSSNKEHPARPVR